MRLVEATNGIAPIGKRFEISSSDTRKTILEAPIRADNFVKSCHYVDLFDDLSKRIAKYENEIFIAACIENVNLRGRIIEYIIAVEDVKVREQLISALLNKTPLPKLHTCNKLGDYSNFYQKTKLYL